MKNVSFLIKFALLTTLLMSVNSNDLISHLMSTILDDKSFKSCEVVLVTLTGNEFDNVNLNSTTNIHSDPAALLPIYETLLVSSGIFTLEQRGNPENNKSKAVKYKRLKDVHRFIAKQCGIALLYFSQVTPVQSKWLFDTIIPRYLPIIRKDEDYFLFVFNSDSEAEEMLISHDLGRKIKFKVGIVSQSKESMQAKIKQVDLYAENGECTVNTAKIMPSSGEMEFLFPDKSNFNGKVLRVVNPKAPSYFEMVPQRNGHTYRPVRGLYKVWLDVMMEQFNFTIHLSLSSASGSTGKRLKNGTWVGSVGDILSGRADMASFNGHIYNRHEYVDWSAPLTYEWMVFITHKRKSFFSPSAIYRPFPNVLWIGFLVSVIIMGSTLKMISKLVYRTDPLSFRGMIMYIFSSFMEQDAQFYLEIIHLHSIRVLLAFWLLFALVISTAYKGKLVSLIAFPELSWVPTTFDELAYSNYRVGLNVIGKGGATYSVLSTSKSPVYQTFFKRMELYADPVNCLRAAFQNDLGCLMVKSVADFFGAKNFTDKFGRNPFQASGQTALFREDGYIWEKRAIFRRKFDKVTWSMMESGLTNYWFHQDLENVKKKRLDWERQHPGEHSVVKIPKENDGPSKLQIVHLLGLFYVYACGNVAGVLCLTLLEVIRSRQQKIKARIHHHRGRK